MNIRDLNSFKKKALQWANTFDTCCCFDSNDYPDQYGNFDLLVAAGANQQLDRSAGQAFDDLKSFYDQHKNWMFGLMSYDLKNETEQLQSAHSDNLCFPDLFFFVPTYLLIVKNGKAEMLLGNPEVLSHISGMQIQYRPSSAVSFHAKIDQAAYIKIIENLQQHIRRGDIYEVNFCQEFFATNAVIDPLFILERLNQISPTPFSGFFKIRERYILSASPERFLCKRGSKLISQPIKGTAKRGSGTEEDALVRTRFKEDAKEQAENVMIVDLVRNDLTKSAIKGSVQVEELFGVYAFPQVYQMISTVTCSISPAVHLVDAIKNAFPMGSMTGAPKKRSMELIEQYEHSKRGAYSGAMGYIDPKGDFDFNVLIRSIFYREDKQFLSFQVGGAITYAANAADEYEECMLKASAMIKALEN
ncbi:MAG: anthranilate synthase component I family protein [Bacteroidota bacterium]